MNRRGIFHRRLWTMLRQYQSRGFPDICLVGLFSETHDALNNAAENYDYSLALACRFNTSLDMARSGYEVLGQSEVARNDTFLVLPLQSNTLSLQPPDRIRMTTRQGEIISPYEDFEIASPVNRGTAEVFFRLRPVDDYDDPTL